MQDKRVQFLHDILDFLISLIRLISITNFRTTHKINRKSERCIVMGTGPSLSDLLKKNSNMLNDCDLVAVNFMGLSPEFMSYKPSIYVLCDPAFWFSSEIPESTCVKVRDFYHYMVENVSWEIQLYIPYKAKKGEMHEILSHNSNIRVYYYNKTRVDGFKWFRYMILKRQWGMFRTENVIVAALLLAIYSDYKQIYLMGADSNWMKYLWVNEQNHLRLTDVHFHGKEEDRTLSIKMHEMCDSLYKVFKSYIDIENYSKHEEIRIYNLNPLSFIDAFEKKESGFEKKDII